MSTIYLWGKPIITQPSKTPHPQVQCLTTPSPLISLSCGSNYCVIVTEEETLAVGDNNEGQLGLGSVKNTGLALIKINLGTQYKIREVSCGEHHTLLLDHNGYVFSSGKGDCGQLGREKTRQSSQFGFVISGATHVSAGKDHSLALCAPKVLGWGNSKEGQLGLLNQKHYFRPQELNVYPCSEIFAGFKFSIFVTSKGVFSTGLNDKWQLGLGHSNSIQMPRKIPIQEEVMNVTGGSYCAVSTKKRQWYLWGSGSLGVFKYPTKMSFLSGAENLVLGQQSGIFLRKGKVWIWGRNSWGELGHQQQNCQYPILSQEFTRLGCSGFSFGQNFIAYYNKEEGIREIYQEDKSCYGSEEEVPIRYHRKDIKSYESADQINESPFFDRHNVVRSGIEQSPKIKRRLYSEESLQEEKSGKQTSYETMYNTLSQTPQSWVDKKYVKLINPVKSIDKYCKQDLQKQNQQLKERLIFQKYQKEKMQKEYLKKINKEEKNKLITKISKLEHIAGSPSRSRYVDSSNVFSSRKQPENISFRPRVIEDDDFEAMGHKISTLKSLVTGMIK